MPQVAARAPAPSKKVAIACALVAFACFAVRAAPGLYWLDSGELATASFVLGIGHPTGFPLVLLWDKAFALLPLGEVGFRTALGSAAATALAIGVVVDLAVCLGGGGRDATVAAVLAALVLGGAMTPFRQATVTEVYALTALALAIGVRLAVTAMEHGPAGKRAALALALVSGLSLGVHASYRLLLLPPLLVLFVVLLRRGRRELVLAPALVAVGAGVCAYLPVRAARRPFTDWGDPRTLRDFWAALMATRIRRAFVGKMLSRVGAVVAAHAHTFGRLELAQVGPLALALAAVGVAALTMSARGGEGGRTRGERAAAGVGLALALCVVAGDALYSFWLNPMGMGDLQCGEPFTMGVALLAAVGVAALARRAGRAAPFVAAVLVCVAAAEPVLAQAGNKLHGTPVTPSDWSDAVLAQAPPCALLLVTNDDTASGLLYAQGVAGRRPDVLAVVRQHAWDTAEMALRFEHAGGGPQSASGWARFAGFPESVRIARGADEIAALVTDARRHGETVLAEPGNDLRLPAGLMARPGVPLWTVEADGVSGPVVDPVAAARAYARLLPHRDDPPAAELLAFEWVALGRTAARAGEGHAAATLFAQALAIQPDDAAALVDLAWLRAAAGDRTGALTLAERAVAAEPDDGPSVLAAARYRLLLGDERDASRLAQRALQVDPEEGAEVAEALALRGTIEARHGAMARARRDLCRALAVDPEQRDARANLALLARVTGSAACP